MAQLDAEEVQRDCVTGGKGGGPQFVNIEDVLKQTKGKEAAGGDASGGGAGADFDDGLDEHNEL